MSKCGLLRAKASCSRPLPSLSGLPAATRVGQLAIQRVLHCEELETEGEEEDEEPHTTDGGTIQPSDAKSSCDAARIPSDRSAPRLFGQPEAFVASLVTSSTRAIGAGRWHTVQ